MTQIRRGPTATRPHAHLGDAGWSFLAPTAPSRIRFQSLLPFRSTPALTTPFPPSSCLPRTASIHPAGGGLSGDGQPGHRESRAGAAGFSWHDPPSRPRPSSRPARIISGREAIVFGRAGTGRTLAEPPCPAHPFNSVGRAYSHQPQFANANRLGDHSTSSWRASAEPPRSARNCSNNFSICDRICLKVRPVVSAI